MFQGSLLVQPRLLRKSLVPARKSRKPTPGDRREWTSLGCGSRKTLRRKPNFAFDMKLVSVGESVVEPVLLVAMVDRQSPSNWLIGAVRGRLRYRDMARLGLRFWRFKLRYEKSIRGPRCYPSWRKQ